MLALIVSVPVFSRVDDQGRVPVSPEGAFAATELFQFFSDVEINLHHFLYRWAAVKPPGGAEREGAFAELALREVDLAVLSGLSSADRQAWNDAMVYYREKIVGRRLLFDRGLVALRDALAGKSPRDAVPGEDQAVFRHLDRVLPLYQRFWWPDHDRANRAWVGRVIPGLIHHEIAVAERIARAYDARWPSPPNRVDVVVYANRTEAYTTGEPHTTLSSVHPPLHMPWAFEMLFHEASHSDALEGPLRQQIVEAFAPARPPRNLWHIILFATAGEASRSILVGAGQADYEPYAQRNRVSYRNEMDRRCWEAVRQHWVPVLENQPLKDVLPAIANQLKGE